MGRLKDPLWIMVEGVDGAGKTTIVQKCATILGRDEASPGGVGRRPVVMQCLSFNTPREDYIDVVVPLINAGIHVIQDRGVVSGPVYEPIMRDDKERLKWMLELVPEAIQLGAVVLFVDAKLDKLIDRVSERGDDYVNVDQLEALQNAYYREMELWRGYGGKAVDVDTTDGWLGDDDLKLVLSLIAAQ